MAYTTIRMTFNGFPQYLQATLNALDELPAKVHANPVFTKEIDPAALESAKRFIVQVAALLAKRGYRWNEPQVSTQDQGDVEFGWWYADKTLLFSVTASEIYYLRVQGAKIEYQTYEGRNPTPEQVLAFWKWLYIAPARVSENRTPKLRG